MQYTHQTLGWMAEWLCSGLQSRLLRFDSGFSLKYYENWNYRIWICWKALCNAFHDSVELFKVDLKLNTTIEELNEFSPDATFICLPTPMKDDGSQDISIVEKIFYKIKDLNLSGLIILKSTVHPGNINILEKILPDFVYNPEFLREKHASDDFINQNRVLFLVEKKTPELSSLKFILTIQKANTLNIFLLMQFQHL